MNLQCLNPQEFKQALQRQDGILIDVRQMEEWQAAHIANAVLLPLDQLTQTIQQHAPQPQQHIYLYCQKGRRSHQAGLLLLSLGYEHVYQLEGGLDEWKNSGFPCQSESL